MHPIEQITAHFKANETLFIDVPEWAGADGVPLRIYWKLLTVEQRRKLHARDDRTDVDVLIAMALDGDGKKMFTIEHKPLLLRHASAEIITRVVEAMLRLTHLTDKLIEDAEKN